MGNSEKTKLLWNESAIDYDKHMADTGHYDAQENLYKLLSHYFTSPILDLASGTGFLASLLRTNGHAVVLNDFSEKMEQVSKRTFNTEADIEFSQQDASNFSFNKKLRTILSCNLFYYLKDRVAAIEHWKTYLEDEGVIILFEEYPFQKPESKEMSKNTEKLMELIDPLSPEEIKNIFAEQGFSMIEEQSLPIDTKHKLFGFVFTKN